MLEAPSPPDPAQLTELGLRFVGVHGRAATPAVERVVPTAEA
jgi:hypothetical protein